MVVAGRGFPNAQETIRQLIDLPNSRAIAFGQPHYDAAEKAFDRFGKRLWRSIKYEEVYLHAYKTVSEARLGIGRYLTFYNTRRPHSSLDRLTPDQAYFNALAPMMAAA